jgi:uncharacterized membrane protein YqjE
MQDERPPLVTPPNSDAADRSLIEDVRQLAQDGKTLIEAELAYQKSRAVVAGVGVKGVVAYIALAVTLVIFALVSLTVGLLIALTPWLSAFGATAVVTLGLLGGAALCGWIGKSRWEAMVDHLTNKDDGT